MRWWAHYGRYCPKCPNIKVTVVDMNEERIFAWNNPNFDNRPIYGQGLKEVVAEAQGRNLFFSNDVNGVIDATEMVFLSMNTPIKIYNIDKGIAAD